MASGVQVLYIRDKCEGSIWRYGVFRSCPGIHHIGYEDRVDPQTCNGYLNRYGKDLAAEIARRDNFGFHLGFWPPGNRLSKNRRGLINIL